MDNDQIVSRMNTYLHTSANVLAEWLESCYPEHRKIGGRTVL